MLSPEEAEKEGTGCQPPGVLAGVPRGVRPNPDPGGLREGRPNFTGGPLLTP
jgi:hypothetical protein